MTRLPVGEPDQVRIQEPDGSLEALATATDAAAIAEHDEADRCRQFLHDLAPDAPPPGA
jgi:hypothetical protein